MPIRPTSFFVPGAAGMDFILDDKFIKGGVHIVASTAERDALPAGIKKPGMLVILADTKKTQQLNDDGSFSDFITGSNLSPYVANVPILIDTSNTIGIDSAYILPMQPGNAGDYLRLRTDGAAEWNTINLNGVQGNRVITTYTCTQQIAPGEHLDFPMALGKTVMLLKLRVDVPLIKVEVFSTSDYTERNPYTFSSDPLVMEDDGVSVLGDGSLFKGRRFSFLCNLEDPPIAVTYWRVTNNGSTPVTPTFDLAYLTLE